MTREAAKTGPGAMVLVAIEQGFPEAERIISDPLAYPILPMSSRFWVRVSLMARDWIVAKTEQNAPGLWGSMMARKRYIDDVVTEAVGGSVDAVVNLGAGFDTRPFRLPELETVPVWEVDQSVNIEVKKDRLNVISGGVPEHVTLVPIDFDREDLDTVLSKHGCDSSMKTIFIWEGVTQYVTEPGIRATMEYLATAPAGSRLVFTYTPKDFIDGENMYGHEKIYRRMRVKDTIWHTGFDPEKIDGFLADYGWRVREHLGYDELGERYVRPTGRALRWMAIERIVHAQKIERGS
jgi:methyltransferase (TIGR00027 family)